MNRALSFILALFLTATVHGYNYTETDLNDTITDFGADSVKTTKAFPLSRYEDAAVIVLVDDSSSAGFASDSLAAVLRYQLGYLTLDSAGLIDTTWQPSRPRLDTLLAANLGSVDDDAYVDSTGALFRATTGFDTTNVPGYAVYSRWFLPEWAPFIRYIISGETGNETTPLQLIIQHSQRLYVNTR